MAFDARKLDKMTRMELLDSRQQLRRSRSLLAEYVAERGGDRCFERTVDALARAVQAIDSALTQDDKGNLPAIPI